MPKTLMELPFPLGGLALSRAYQAQEPHTTPECLNVRPDSNLEQRTQGGSRPGLNKVFQEQIGSPNNRPVRMATQVRIVPSMQMQVLTWAEDFSGLVSLNPPWPGWSTFTTVPASTLQPEWVHKHLLTLGSLTTENRSMSRIEAFTGFDATKEYSLQIETRTSGGSFWGKLRLHFGMSQSSPSQNAAGSSYVQIAFFNQTGNTTDYIITVFSGGSLIGSTGDQVTTMGGEMYRTFRVYVNYQGVPNNVGVQFGTGMVFQFTVSAPTGPRWGISVEKIAGQQLPSGFVGHPQFRYLVFSYFSTGISTGISAPNRNFPVFSAYDDQLSTPGGGLWRESDVGGMLMRVNINPRNLAANLNLQATERGGVLFIADYGIKHEGTAVFSSDSSFSDQGGANFVTLGITTDDCVVFPFPSGAIKAGTYGILTVTATTITLVDVGVPEVPFAGGSGQTVAYRIERAPKVYSVNGDVFGVLTAGVDTEDLYAFGTDFIKGPVPCGNPLICLYRDRIVLAGNPKTPQVWFMSRQGDPFDWYPGGSDDDVGRPIAGLNADAGVIGEPITCLAPFSDDYLLFGCTDSLWILHGDPAFGGQIDNLSKTIGVVDRNAWSRTPEGDCYILSRDGLYFVRVGSNMPPQSVSRERMPLELVNVDRDQYETMLAYDVNERGIQVYLTPKDGLTNRRGFWYDIQTDSWWPAQLAADHQPTSIMEYRADRSSSSAVLLGCRDGYVRRYLFGQSLDDGLSYDSDIILGAYRAGPDATMEGLLQELTIRLAESSNPVDWEIYLGETAEQAVIRARAASPVFLSATLPAGLSRRYHPRARAKYFCLRFKKNAATSDLPWAVEGIAALLRSGGRERKAGTSG